MRNKTINLKDIAGWIGVLCILSAFTLATFGIITPIGLLYGLVNFIGALGLMVSSYAKKDFQPVFLNVIWLIVALIGIVRSLL